MSVRVASRPAFQRPTAPRRQRTWSRNRRSHQARYRIDNHDLSVAAFADEWPRAAVHPGEMSRLSVDPSWALYLDPRDFEGTADYACRIGVTARLSLCASRSSMRSVATPVDSREEGLPRFGNRQRGDLLLRAQVAVPQRLTPRQRDLYEQLRALEHTPSSTTSSTRTRHRAKRSVHKSAAEHWP